MRVGFDARWYNDSGVGNYVAGLLGALAECARDFELIAYENPNNRLPGLDRLGLVRVAVHAPKYSAREQVELAVRCYKDRIDVFHSPFYVVPFAAPCPVVATVHDPIPFLFRIYPPPKQAVVKIGYRAAVRRAAHVIAVSQTTATDLRRLLGVPAQKLSIVYNAVSPRYFHPHGGKDEPGLLHRKYGISPGYVVISTPRNWRTKNLGVALQVLASVHASNPERLQCVMYGPRPCPQALAPEAGVDMIRTGFIPPDELGMLFRHARAFLLTSLYEGFGLPLLEAMSCGCPVVTANGGALAEIAANGAQAFDAMDVRGMADAISTLLCDENERERWQVRALARASEFSWHKAAEQTVAVYRQMCNSPF